MAFGTIVRMYKLFFSSSVNWIRIREEKRGADRWCRCLMTWWVQSIMGPKWSHKEASSSRRIRKAHDGPDQIKPDSFCSKSMSERQKKRKDDYLTLSMGSTKIKWLIFFTFCLFPAWLCMLDTYVLPPRVDVASAVVTAGHNWKEQQFHPLLLGALPGGSRQDLKRFFSSRLSKGNCWWQVLLVAGTQGLCQCR